MGKASSFDDLPSEKTQDAGKTGGTSLTSLNYPDVCPPARVAFWSGHHPLLCWSSSERAGLITHDTTGLCLHAEAAAMPQRLYCMCFC